MKTVHCLTACVLASGVMGRPAQAQTTSPVVPASAAKAVPASLGGAVEAAWQRAVLAKETEGQRSRAEAVRPAADSWWAAPPALELSHRDDRGLSNAGKRESAVAVAWPLWLPGQRAARGATVDTATAQALAAVRAGRLRIAGEVREAAWSIIAQRAAVT